MIRSIERVSEETALEIHRQKIKQYGGMGGVREEGLLEAAIAQPWQSFDGIELYLSIEEKAARIGYEIISQHPFFDGNKRTGAALVGIPPARQRDEVQASCRRLPQDGHGGCGWISRLQRLA